VNRVLTVRLVNPTIGLINTALGIVTFPGVSALDWQESRGELASRIRRLCIWILLARESSDPIGWFLSATNAFGIFGAFQLVKLVSRGWHAALKSCRFHQRTVAWLEYRGAEPRSLHYVTRGFSRATQQEISLDTTPAKWLAVYATTQLSGSDGGLPGKLLYSPPGWVVARLPCPVGRCILRLAGW